MGSKGGAGGGAKAYVGVVIIQCINAGMILLSKAAVSTGLKPAVFIAYRHASATLVLLPFAFFFTNHTHASPLTFTALAKIFVLASFGLVLGFNLQFVGLELVSVTFGIAMYSIVPSLVFIMAVCLRIEKVGIREWHGLAKIVGTLIGLSGAMAFTFYSGPPLFNTHQYQPHPHQQTTHTTSHDWIKGSIFTILSQIFYAMWLTMQGIGKLGNKNLKPKMGRSTGGAEAYVGVVIIQCINTGMILLSKAAVSAGLKPAIFIVYRQASATLVLLPFTFFFTDHTAPPLPFTAYFKIFVVSSLGLVLGLNFQYSGLELVSATFGIAMYSIVPSLVFIMSVCLRIEKVGIREWHGLAKIVGTLIGLSGAMAFTFYSGPPLFNTHHYQPHPHQQTTHTTSHDWIKGSIFTILSQIFYAMWLTMQGPLLKQYPGKFRLTFLQTGFSCITATAYGAAVNRKPSSWKLGWDIQLLSVIYSGVVVTGISYTLQAWVIEKRGPLFIAIFSPLALILAAIVSALFLHESLYWGSVLGCGLLIIGLYSFLWGTDNEAQNSGPILQLDQSIEEAQFECITVSSASKEDRNVHPMVEN